MVKYQISSNPQHNIQILGVIHYKHHVKLIHCGQKIRKLTLLHTKKKKITKRLNLHFLWTATRFSSSGLYFIVTSYLGNKMIFAIICTFSMICPICPVVQQVIFEINKLYTKIVVTPRCPRQFVNVREGLPVPRRLWYKTHI